MARTYLERRVIKAGIAKSGGSLMSSEDIGNLRVKTFSPVLQATYTLLGIFLFVFGMWVQSRIGNMAVSMGLVLVGFLNAAFGIHGRPRLVSTIGGLDLDELAGEIAREAPAGGEPRRS